MILTEDVRNSRTTFDCFYDLTDTEAHQIQTLRRVQPLHRQVWPPLSLGGELCRYVNYTTDVGDVKNTSSPKEQAAHSFHPHTESCGFILFSFSKLHQILIKKWVTVITFQIILIFLLSAAHKIHLLWEPIAVGIGQEAVYKLHKLPDYDRAEI